MKSLLMFVLLCPSCTNCRSFSIQERDEKLSWENQLASLQEKPVACKSKRMRTHSSNYRQFCTVVCIVVNIKIYINNECLNEIVNFLITKRIAVPFILC